MLNEIPQHGQTKQCKYAHIPRSRVYGLFIMLFILKLDAVYALLYVMMAI